MLSLLRSLNLQFNTIAKINGLATITNAQKIAKQEDILSSIVLN